MTPIEIERLATEDSRFYKIVKDDGTELYLPSVTTILHHVGITNSFLDGWKEEQSERIGVLGKRIQLMLDQQRGTKVHGAIEDWHDGKDIDWKKDGYTDDEWARIHRYMQWENEKQPKFLQSEMVVYSEKYGFAGTIDGIAKISDWDLIVDYKTGKDVYADHLLQAAAYHIAYEEMFDEALDGVLVLALAARTKKGWKEEVLGGKDLARFREGFLLHKELFDWEFYDFVPKTECFPSHYTHE